MTAFLNNAPKVGEVDFEEDLSDDLFDPSQESKGFYERHWNWALAQATAMMQPIAERLGQKGVAFTPQNDELAVWPKDEVNKVCHGVLETLSPRDLFGCTTQEDWHGNYGENYVKPRSTTYLAQEWAADYISNAAHHEISHQAIISVRQMIHKDHMNRRNNGYRTLSDVAYKCLMDRFAKMDKELDSMDVAKFDNRIGKIVIEKKSDVWPMLKALVDVYGEFLQIGY